MRISISDEFKFAHYSKFLPICLNMSRGEQRFFTIVKMRIHLLSYIHIFLILQSIRLIFRIGQWFAAFFCSCVLQLHKVVFLSIGTTCGTEEYMTLHGLNILHAHRYITIRGYLAELVIGWFALVRRDLCITDLRMHVIRLKVEWFMWRWAMGFAHKCYPAQGRMVHVAMSYGLAHACFPAQGRMVHVAMSYGFAHECYPARGRMVHLAVSYGLGLFL